MMTLPLMHSHLGLAIFLFQDDAAATPLLPASAPGGALVEMVRNSGPVALAVLVALLLASIYSWAIMLTKWRRFARAREQYQPSPLVAVFTEINDEYQRQSGGRGMPRNPTALERAAQTASSETLTTMESRMTWLATIAAIAPFIGLLGTVMGIIDAFHGMGAAGSATLRQVGPGISEALITTAAGLVVAIPAVIGYNQLTAQLRDFAARMDDFGRELLNAIENAAMLAPPAAEEQPRRRMF